MSTYTGCVARIADHGMTSRYPITIAAPNNSHPPRFNSSFALGRGCLASGTASNASDVLARGVDVVVVAASIISPKWLMTFRNAMNWPLGGSNHQRAGCSVDKRRYSGDLATIVVHPLTRF